MSRHAFAIAGTQSGCGKTTVTLALMAALSARGLRVAPFKVGPDFIDPGHHAAVCGVPSRNLDGWMMPRRYNEALFARRLAEADVAVVEGVMGLFDGFDGRAETGSTAEMAKWLDLPVVLVIDARSMARSAAALVSGFAGFDPALRVCGVILNNVGSERHEGYLREALEAHCPHVPVLGVIPREAEIAIPERHLGLVIAEEAGADTGRAQMLAELAERHVAIPRLLALSERAAPPAADPFPQVAPLASPVTIAVARDAAFCFYYEDNFDLLLRFGAHLAFFSPLAGEPLPVGASGLYLGGGYPELHAARLADGGREAFRETVAGAARRGMPVYAECGGLMSLSRFIETGDGARCEMAGVLPFGTRMLRRRKALGYTEARIVSPCLLGEPGAVLRGHEFHYSEIAGDAGGTPRCYEIAPRRGGAPRPEGYAPAANILASYVHVHFGSAPEAPRRFVARCREFAASQGRSSS